MVRKQRLTLGALVRQARKANGWTQERLAYETELSLPTISRIERNEQSPGIETLQRIARALEMTTDDLAGEAA